MLLPPWGFSMQPKPRRPTGVTILGILSILAGLGGIIVGAGALALFGLAASAYPGGAAVAAGFWGIILFTLVFGVFFGKRVFRGKRLALALGLHGRVRYTSFLILLNF